MTALPHVQTSSVPHWLLMLLALLVSTSVFAEGANATADAEGFSDEGWDDDDDDDFDLEDLMEIQVVSVAGVEQAVKDTPASIFVITQRDIRRSGQRTVQDLLRMVPGLHVAQLSSSIWAVGARGAGGRFSNTLLVLVDGRVIYNGLFAGVFWDEQNIVIEDIERIEVVRGPGATLWGANAVDGVINIVTKKASDTQGMLVSGGAGDHFTNFGTLRYGGKVSDSTHYRIFAQYHETDSFHFLDGADSDDRWDGFVGGFRVDHDSDSALKATLQGEIRYSNSDEPVTSFTLAPPTTFVTGADQSLRGGYLLGRLERDLDNDSGWSLQAYYDRTQRNFNILHVLLETYDLAFRHHFQLGESHRLIWGASYRHRYDDSTGGVRLSFDPDSRRTDKGGVFIQDTISLNDNWSLMLGSKFEHNQYTGFEVQPGARISWRRSSTQLIWASVSRAVRTAARSDQDVVLTTAVIPPPPALLQAKLLGTDGVQGEDLIAVEVGCRSQPREDLFLDISTFFNRFKNLSALVTDPTNPLNLLLDAKDNSRVYGTEISGHWQVNERARLLGGYSWVKTNTSGATDAGETTYPKNQFFLRSEVDLTDNLEWNAAAYYTDEIRGESVPSLVRLDLGLTWRPRPGVEFAVWGQNLIEDGQPEGIDTNLVGTQLETDRSFYAQLTLHF